MTSFELRGRFYYFIKYKILGFLGLFILLLLISLGTHGYLGNTPPGPGWALALGLVSLAMMYFGFLVLRVVPADDCTICGKTNMEVTSSRGVNYCNSCYENGAAQAYFDGMDRQSRESEKAQPQIEERQQSPPPQVKEIIKEREVIHRETIVKIRCGHCRKLFEEEKGSCPYCGAPA